MCHPLRAYPKNGDFWGNRYYNIDTTFTFFCSESWMVRSWKTFQCQTSWLQSPVSPPVCSAHLLSLFLLFFGVFFSIFAVPSLVISSDAAVHSVHWLVDDMCPLNRGREKKRHDRDGKTRGFPPSLNGVYSIKTDAGSNFMVSTLREKKKIKRIKSCIKYISMECLLFTFSIF